MNAICGRFALVDFGLAQRLSTSEPSESRSENAESTSQQNGRQSQVCATVFSL